MHSSNAYTALLEERTRKEQELPHGSSAFQARREGRLLTNYFNRHLRGPLGLRSTQVDVLASVKRHHNAKIAEIARFMNLAPSTLSRSLRRLEAHGLVTIAIASHDRRQRWAKLTPLGEERLARAQGTTTDVLQIRLRSKLGAEVYKRIRGDCEIIVRAIYMQVWEETEVERRTSLMPRSYYEKRWAGWTDEDILAGRILEPHERLMTYGQRLAADRAKREASEAAAAAGNSPEKPPPKDEKK